MLRHCVILAVLGVALGAPRPQYQVQQREEGIPPHLLRQYIGGGAAQHQQPRPVPQAAPAPAPVRLPYNVQNEEYQQQQYQPQQQQQYQPQPQQQYQQQPQQQYRAQQEKEPEDFDSNPSYQFGFDVNDDQFTNYQTRKEQRDGGVIKGSYSVVDSDGFIRTVTYTADPKEGFKAEVSRQPTDIVVKIPTPKPQLQQEQHIQPQPQQQLAHAQPRPQPNQQQYYRYE
ncbi:putative mediator of RNA polymerase II transcription subunit 21 isoform X2 [Leptidea sinapis]|uniref:putative mediator of RNA polymerase II transcription subunit 21 isoform X2 n=1 Tax=Leptidea sinapis TaxID=189913 RepID=UPI0021C44ED4|nr:putative mediator of RNA polymerase II transcription subunit 21 isoform X2 [Leptidea sinapis]